MTVRGPWFVNVEEPQAVNVQVLQAANVRGPWIVNVQEPQIVNVQEQEP